MTLLPEIERGILDAVRRDQKRRRASLPLRLLPRPLRLPLAALTVLLGSTTIALAASGLIITGSPVRTHGQLKPTVRFGVPAAGTSRLLPLRVEDPEGGLPWGMRVLRTTRGFLCVQVGRVDHGRLGELGIDGAFHDDGRFHPLPTKALPSDLEASDSTNIECDSNLHGTFAGEIEGLESSAANNPSAGTGSLATRREISFGLLGSHAVKITYRTAAGTKTRKVLTGLGAYLIVQPARAGERVAGESATMGSLEHPVAPNGDLTAISYRYGQRTCINNGHDYRSMLHSCGLSDGAPPKPPALPTVHEPIQVRFHLHGHTVMSSELSFRAPYPVTSVTQSYSVDTYSCRASNSKRPLESGGGSSQRDIATGGLVRIRISGSAFACNQFARVTVWYTRELNGVPAFTRIGSTTIRIPKGTHAESLP